MAQSDEEPEFTPEDEAALAGEWSWFIDVVRPALAGGMGGFIDDDLASVGAWGFDPADVVAATARDKKRRGGRVGFVLVEAPGDVRTGMGVSPDDLRAAVAELERS